MERGRLDAVTLTEQDVGVSVGVGFLNVIDPPGERVECAPPGLALGGDALGGNALAAHAHHLGAGRPHVGQPGLPGTLHLQVLAGRDRALGVRQQLCQEVLERLVITLSIREAAKERLRTPEGQELGRVVMETDHTDWWFLGPDQSWWERKNGSRKNLPKIAVPDPADPADGENEDGQ